MNLTQPCSHRELQHLADYGRYVTLSQAEIQAIARSNLGEATGLWLWLRGALYTGDTGTIERTWKQIAEAMGKPESTIRKWGKKLEAAGYLDVTRRKADDKMNMPNIFRACLPAMVASQLVEGLKHRRRVGEGRVMNETVESPEVETEALPRPVDKPIENKALPAAVKDEPAKVYIMYTGEQLETMAKAHGLPATKAHAFRDATARVEEGAMVLYGNKIILECFLGTNDFKAALLAQCGAKSLRVVQGLISQGATHTPKIPDKSPAPTRSTVEHTRQIKTFSLQAGMPNTLKALVDRVREYLETLPRWVYTRSRDQIAREIIWQIHHDKTLQYKRTEEAIRMCLSLVRKERYATPIGIASGMALTTESYQELMA